MRTKKQPLSDKVEKIIMTAKGEHKFYTKNFRDKKNKLKHKDYYQDFVRRFFEKIADHLISNPNGVFIDGLGYFFCFMIPNKDIFKSRFKISMNLSTDGYTYCITYAPVKTLAEWSMDKSFSVFIKKAIKDKLLSGKMRYKSHFHYLKRKKLIY